MGELRAARGAVMGRYHENLRGRLAEIEALSGKLGDDPGLADQIRSHAHQVRGSGGSYGYPELSVLAANLEDSSPDQVPIHLAVLIDHIRGIVGDDDRDRILVVEDDPDFSSLLVERLHDEGWEAAAVGRLDAAIEAVDVLNPALVVLDLVLPDGDGRELVAHLADETGTDAPEFVVMAATAPPAVHAECLLLGANVVLEKSQGLDLLVAAITARLAHREQIRRTVRVDALTSLANRAALAEGFERARSVAVRHETPFALAFLDIDNFKPLNDRYGHLVGDSALAHFAEVMTEELRAGELVTRWGGDEFVVLFPDVDARSAATALGRVAARLGRDPMSCSGGELVVLSFSAGVFDVDGQPLEVAMHHADLRLLAAKALGRDRICCHDPSEVWSPSVLLVEDDEDVATYLSGLLRDDGYLVEIASSGSDALRRLALSRPELVLLDLGLPDISGFEVIERIRRDQSVSGVPVIVQTARGDEDAVETAFTLGADDFIQKPIRDRDLLARIGRLMRAQGSKR